jgi:ATP-dependent helicase/nuclease subunit A
MTIHRSKGLEFPVVVLADMGNLGRRTGRGSAPYYVSSQYGITVNLGTQNYFTEIGEGESENEELAEIKRLMYVALTRARSHLILAGTHKTRNRKTPRAHLNLLLRALDLHDRLPMHGNEGVNALERGTALHIHPIPVLRWSELTGRSSPARVIGEDLRKTLYERPAARRSTPKRETSVTDLCIRLEPLLRRSWGAEEGTTASPLLPPVLLPSLPADDILKELGLETALGNLTHQLLAEWGADPAAQPPEPDWTRIPREHRDLLLRSAVTLCRNFFGSELGRLCRQADPVEREVPFLHLHEDEAGPLYISGKIDLAFRRGKVLYLVDFKTDQRYVPGEHECQLAMYSLAMAGQTEGEIRNFLFLLRSGQAIRCQRHIDLAEWIPRVRHLL